MPRRACDRCHGIRARCQFDYGHDACERCLRLNHACRSERNVRKAGRPRKYRSKKDPQLKFANAASPHQDGPSSQSPADVLQSLNDLDPQEVQLAIRFLQSQRFENSFVKDSALSVPMQSDPIRLFLSAPGRVKDALLALASIMLSERGTATLNAEVAAASMDRCCKAMERLREADTTSIDDAKATLFVATTLISVNDMTIGYGFLPIARAALLSIKPWYHELVNIRSSEFDPHLIPVMFAEAAECVRSRQIPTYRYGTGSTHRIDPSFGIAHRVLHHIYDTCVLSHGINSGLLDTIEATRRACKIHEAVNGWEPSGWTILEHDQCSPLSETQQSNIIRHGACYKLLVLLLLHQVAPHIQQNSTNSAELASRLRHDIAHVSEDSEPSRPHVQYLLFPYFIACTELRDETEQAHVLENMESLSGGIATQSCNRMFEFLKYVWTIRGVNPTTSWFDLVEEGIEFSIGP